MYHAFRKQRIIVETEVQRLFVRWPRWPVYVLLARLFIGDLQAILLGTEWGNTFTVSCSINSKFIPLRDTRGRQSLAGSNLLVFKLQASLTVLEDRCSIYVVPEHILAYFIINSNKNKWLSLRRMVTTFMYLCVRLSGL